MRSRIGEVTGVLGGAILAIALSSTALAGAGAPGASKKSAAGSGYAPVNGLKLYYEIHNSASVSAPPLVLLHGGGSTIETSFGKVLPLLSAKRRVIAFEQQGHGHTGDVDRPFSFQQSAEDTVALLAFLEIAQADLYGYSNGHSCPKRFLS